jgi:hypothetical protein
MPAAQSIERRRIIIGQAEPWPHSVSLTSKGISDRLIGIFSDLGRAPNGPPC